MIHWALVAALSCPAQAQALAGRWYPDVSAASAHTGVPKVVIAAILRTESSGRARVRSKAGARGLMQVMPRTARLMGVDRWWIPRLNILAGSRYVAFLLKKYHGDLPSALAAYNAGPKAVARFSGIPPWAETRRYVGEVFQKMWGTKCRIQ